jgi:hypothetical protein
VGSLRSRCDRLPSRGFSWAGASGGLAGGCPGDEWEPYRLPCGAPAPQKTLTRPVPRPGPGPGRTTPLGPVVAATVWARSGPLLCRSGHVGGTYREATSAWLIRAHLHGRSGGGYRTRGLSGRFSHQQSKISGTDGSSTSTLHRFRRRVGL